MTYGLRLTSSGIEPDLLTIGPGATRDPFLPRPLPFSGTLHIRKLCTSHACRADSELTTLKLGVRRSMGFTEYTQIISPYDKRSFGRITRRKRDRYPPLYQRKPRFQKEKSYRHVVPFIYVTRLKSSNPSSSHEDSFIELPLKPETSKRPVHLKV